MCSAVQQCQIYDLREADYNVADGCNYERLNITFGCTYDRLIKLTRLARIHEFNDDGSSSGGGSSGDVIVAYSLCIFFGLFVNSVIFVCWIFCCPKYSPSGGIICCPENSPSGGIIYPGGTLPSHATTSNYRSPATSGNYPSPATSGAEISTPNDHSATGGANLPPPSYNDVLKW